MTLKCKIKEVSEVQNHKDFEKIKNYEEVQVD